MKNVEVELFSSVDDYEINQICSILAENNIPFIKKSTGSGSYMDLYMGHSIQEKRIFVSTKDYDRSLELISSFISDDVNNDKEIEYENDTTSDKYILARRGLGLLILGFPILVIILVILISLIYN